MSKPYLLPEKVFWQIDGAAEAWQLHEDTNESESVTTENGNEITLLVDSNQRPASPLLLSTTYPYYFGKENEHGVNAEIQDAYNPHITMKHLLKAVKKNDVSLLRTYLEGMKESQRLDILSRRQHSTGFTPLCEAVSKDYLEICRILLLFGADVNTKGNYVDGDYTPLQMAVRAGKSAIFQVLLKAGAFDHNFIYNNNASLLQYAIYNNDHETARILIDLGADLSYKAPHFSCAIKGWPYQRPLWIAIDKNNIDMVQLLMVYDIR
jgi:Ankyrin repeats (3 copies)